MTTWNSLSLARMIIATFSWFVMSKWPDFLFTIAVRFICGVVLGGLACVILFYRGILRSFSHNHIRTVGIWLAIWCVGGGLVAVFTVPKWQTPWYKGIRDRRSDDEPLG
jgi:hypothetical protein